MYVYVLGLQTGDTEAVKINSCAPGVRFSARSVPFRNTTVSVIVNNSLKLSVKHLTRRIHTRYQHVTHLLSASKHHCSFYSPIISAHRPQMLLSTHLIIACFSHCSIPLSVLTQLEKRDIK